MVVFPPCWWSPPQGIWYPHPPLKSSKQGILFGPVNLHYNNSDKITLVITFWKITFKGHFPNVNNFIIITTDPRHYAICQQFNQSHQKLLKFLLSMPCGSPRNHPVCPITDGCNRKTTHIETIASVDLIQFLLIMQLHDSMEQLSPHGSLAIWNASGSYIKHHCLKHFMYCRDIVKFQLLFLILASGIQSYIWYTKLPMPFSYSLK